MIWQTAGALVACFLLGLRHGFDYDHLAALADIAAVQRSWKEGMTLGMIYACGHALVILFLGVLVALFHLRLPPSLDAWAPRLTGVTLIVLGLAILAGLIRRPHSHSDARSRWTILIDSFLYARWRMRRHFSPDLERPSPFAWTYSHPSVFGIGALHGLGAETPSQLMVFLLAASLGTPGKTVLGLCVFVCGLVLMNGLMMAGLGGTFCVRRTKRRVGRGLAYAGAAYSLGIGIVFLLNAAGYLPPL